MLKLFEEVSKMQNAMHVNKSPKLRAIEEEGQFLTKQKR